MEYSLDIKYHKILYSGPNLLSYTNINYSSKIKNGQVTINYIYYLNGAVVF